MHYKSLFVSDIHLGTKQCQVQYLLKFIHDNTFDNVFLVGDIIDISSLSYSWYWHVDHNTFIQKILRMSRKNVNCVYILGNHDEHIREFIKDDMIFSIGDIKVCNEYLYNSVAGKKFLLVHGDCFDGAFRSYGWLYWFGDRAYGIALSVNSIFNKIRKIFGLKYWSLSSYLKSKVKGAMAAVNHLEEMVVTRCTSNDYDGLIYGHTHCPALKRIETKKIYNIGDHVESCTCIVETVDGEFQLIRTTDNKILDKSLVY